MHIGYAILMQVNLFPLVGSASLLMILPPKVMASARPVLRGSNKAGKIEKKNNQNVFARTMALCCFSAWLLLESTRLTIFSLMPWENKLMVVPSWRMFADGGVNAGGKWRLVFAIPQGEMDATDIACRPLPH